MRRRRFRARMAELDAALAFVQAVCSAHALARDDGLRLQLLVEELFTNTVSHGHGGDSDSPVMIGLAVQADALLLHYRDRAPRFDPTAPLPAEPLRQIGGAGLRLLASLARTMRYRRAGGANLLDLVLARGGPARP